MALEFLRISSSQLDRLSREQTVFFFPVAPLEDHGPHIPLGLDLLEAEQLCRETAFRLERDLAGWTGVLMPAAPLGIESNTSAFRVTARAHVLRDWLVDSCRSLKAAGFRHFVCWSGHLGPKQLTAIEEAGKMIRKPFSLAPGARRATLVSASSALVSGADVRHQPFRLDPPEHGGARDASVALALGVPLDPAFRQLPAQPRIGTFLSRAFLHRSRKLAGYWGSPALADREVGARAITGSVDEVFPKLRAVWEGANPNALFRSWYSILPFHKSFFKAWLLALSFAGLVCLWIYLNLKAMVSGG